MLIFRITVSTRRDFLEKVLKIFGRLWQSLRKVFCLKNAQWKLLREVFVKSFLTIQWKFLSKVLKETTMEIFFQGFEKVFGKQYGLVLIITSRTKPMILGHVVHFVCVRSSSK